MGNTKTYYVEGELLAGVTLDQFKETVYDGFHSTYCVAEIVEQKGGYLGTREDEGPYIVAAIHSFSLRGDHGPANLSKVMKEFWMHRVDADWSDVWVLHYDVEGFTSWREGPVILKRLQTAPDGARI